MLLKLLQSDLKQAKKIGKNEKINMFKTIWLLLISRIARVHFLIRIKTNNYNKLYKLIANFYLDRLRVYVGNNVVIGEGLMLPHPFNIIIANNVKIGNNVHIGQNVTIGGNFKKKREREDGSLQYLPEISDRVNICAGAVVGGPVRLGCDVIVGANAVITKDVPSNSIVYGQNKIMKRGISLPIEGGSFTTNPL